MVAISDNPAKKVFEWVVLCNEKEFYLTDNQHEYLLENQKERFVSFSDMDLQPAMISWMHQRPAEVIKDKFPCPRCHGRGTKAGEIEYCYGCEGSGIDLKK